MGQAAQPEVIRTGVVTKRSDDATVLRCYRLHVERQGDGLPALTLVDACRHLVAVRIGDARGRERLRTVEVISVSGICQRDALRCTVHHHVLHRAWRIVGRLHIEQQIGVLDFRHERLRRIPDDGGQFRDACQGSCVNACNAPYQILVVHLFWHFQRRSIAALCHPDCLAVV